MDYHTRIAVALALVAIIFPSAFTAPALPQSCTATCRRGHNSNLHYQAGKSYTYNFETEVVTHVERSSDESSRIKVKGHAILAAQSSCDFVLTLQQVAIQSPSGQAISKIDDIEGSSVRFAYQDGVIENICVSDSDSPWSANIKRAIVSLFSHKVSQVVGDAETIEVDISGSCPTKYSVSGNTYNKTKDLNSCTHRDGGATLLQGVPYEVTSKHNSVPLMNSLLECSQVINDGIFHTISCVEDHKLAPLAQKSGEVHTVVKSTITHHSTHDGLQGAKATVPSVPSSIFYDYAEVEEVQRQKSSALHAVDLLNKICKEIETGTVSLKVPGLFLQLKKSVMYTRKDDLKEMYEQVSQGRLCPKAVEKLSKLYLDAAAHAGTDGPIAFIAEVIANGQVSDETQNVFNIYATFAPHPGVQSLEAMDKLISQKDAEPVFLLTASGLSHQYCKNTNSKCLTNNEYISLVNAIARHVHVVSSTEEDVEKVIVALQALGNIDHLTPEAVTAISRLLDDESTISRIKIRALDAFRRDPCNQDLKNKALKIFGNNLITSEVRIQAYLTLANCIKQRDIEGIQNILNVEKSNQVGSFVASHIYGTLKSSSPGKQILKGAFKQLKLPNDYPSDSRLFSHHREISAFSEGANIGGSAEANLIFSQDSYVPRSGSANVTFDAFGRSYNFFEIGAYGQGYEQLIESFFGPVGSQANKFNEIVEGGKNRWAQLSNNLRNRVRREVKSEVSHPDILHIQNKVNIDPNYRQEPITDIYLRVLGTSILAETVSGATEDKKSLSAKLFRGIEELIGEGNNDHKFDITEPILFLDEEIIFPTISGFPLNLDVEGTTILSLEMQKNFAIQDLLSGETTDAKARIMPSAATLLKAKLSVGAGPIESGLSLEGKIHTASGIDIKMVTEKGKLELRVNIPQEKIQLIDMRTDMYWIEQSGDHLEKKTPLKSLVPQERLFEDDCSLFKAVGLKLCVDIKGPSMKANNYFPLSCPSVFAVSIEKIEPSMEGYYLKVATNTQDKNNLEFDLVLDTPGSRSAHKITASAKYLNYRSATPQIKLELESPFKTLSVDYQRSNTDSLKGVSVKIVDDGDSYTGKAELKRTEVGSGFELEPLLQYSLPTGGIVNLLEGKITREVGRKITLDLRAGGKTRSLRGQLSGSVEVVRHSDDHVDYVAEKLQASSEVLGKIIVDGKVGRNNRVYEIDLRTKYGKADQHDFSLKGQVGEPSEGKKVLQVRSRSSRRSFLNFDLDADCSKKQNGWENAFKYTRGLDEATKVVISQVARVTVDSFKLFDIHNEVKVVHPDLHIDLLLQADAKSTPGVERYARATLKAGNTVSGALNYEATGTDLTDYSLKTDAQFSGKTYEFSEISKKESAEKRNFKTRVAVSPGFWYEGVTELSHVFDREQHNLKTQLDTTITSDQFSHPIVFKSVVAAKKDTYGALVKLDAKNTNYVHLESSYKSSKTKPSSAKGKAYVKDYLDATLSQTISRPASDFILKATWIPTNRVLNAESHLKNEGELFNLNADVKWDAVNNPSKSASLRSTITIPSDQWAIDSKNEIEILGRRSEINVKGKVPKDLVNGEHSAEIDLKTSSGKTYALSYTNDLAISAKSKNSKLHLKVDLPETEPYIIDWENHASNVDRKEGTFEVSTDLKAKYNGDQNVNIQGALNSLIPGNYRSASGQFEASGSIIPHPIGFDFKTEVKTGVCEITASGRRGSRKGDVHVKIDLDRFSPKKRLQIDYSLHTPYTAVKSLSGQLKYALFVESLRNFEFSEAGSVTRNEGTECKWATGLIVLDNELKSLVSISEGSNPILELKANGKKIGNKIIGSASSVVRGEKSEVNIDADYEFPNLDVKITGKSQVEALKNFELKVHHKSSSGGQVLETDVLAVANEKRAKITNKLELFPSRVSFDVTLGVNDEPSRQLYFALADTTNNVWNVEAKARWGDAGNYAHTKGNLKRTGDAFDADLTLDSPAFRADKWSVRVSKKLVSGRQSIAVSVEGNSEKVVAVSMDYAKKEERNGDLNTYDGSVKIETRANLNFDGNFRLEDTVLNKQRDNGEEGRRISGNVQLSSNQFPLQLTFLAKRSNVEKRLKATFCNEGEEECKNAEVLIKHHHADNGDVDYQLRAVTETVIGGKTETNGIVVKTIMTENGGQFENTAQLILGKEKSHPVGYKLYRKGHEVGAEVLLPQRIIAAVLFGEKSRNGDLKVDLSFYVDKTKQPNRRISTTLTINERDRGDEDSRGRQVELVLHHPDITKDAKISTVYAYGGNKIVYDVQTVLDVFEANKEIKFGYKVEKNAVQSGFHYVSTSYVLSRGQHIKYETKSEITRTSNQLSMRTEVEFENRKKEKNTWKSDISLSRNRVHLEVDGPSSKVLSVSSSWESHPTGYEIRHEIQLPGMEDVRIIEGKLNTVSPPSAIAKTYTSTSQPGDFYEAFIGFKSNNNFVAGLYDHETEGNNVLADFNVALNSSRSLFIKTDWNTKNVQKVVTKSRTRLEKTAHRLRDIVVTWGKEYVEEIKHICSTLKSATPNLKVVYSAYKKNLADLKTELEADEDTQLILETYNLVHEMTKEHIQVIAQIVGNLKKTAIKALEELKAQAENLPELWEKLVEQIPVTAEAFQEGLDSALDVFLEATRVVAKVFWDALERATEAAPAFVENLGWLVDASIEAGKVAQKSLSAALVKLTEIWKVVKEATNDVLAHPTVKSVIKEILARYKSILAEFIEDTKEQADEFRKWILQILPGEEIQELVRTIAEYVEKKVRQTPVDDAAAQKDIYNKLVAALKKISDEIFTIDLKNGLFIAQVPLPKSIDKLTDILKVFAIDFSKIQLPKLNFRTPSSRLGLQETFNRLKAGASYDSLLPPWRALGLIIGSNYFKTFDGKIYHFEGNCQYILASDFIDRNFTAVLDFDNTGSELKKALIITDGVDTVAIKSDATIWVNGKLTEVTNNAKVGKLSITRKRNTVNVFGEKYGFSGGCSHDFDVCSVTANGYYQGKVAGLFGTYNNEQFDDFTTPEGNIEENEETFVSKWKLDQCVESPLPVHSNTISPAAKIKCTEAFEGRKSSLRPCFGVVDTRDYEYVCERLSVEPGYSAQKSACTAAAAYQKACFHNNVKVDNLEECRSV